MQCMSESVVCVEVRSSVEMRISSRKEGRWLELWGKNVGCGWEEDAFMAVRWHVSRKERKEVSMLHGSRL